MSTSSYSSDIITNWQRIVDNGWEPEISGLYGDVFPVESRAILSDFLKRFYPEPARHFARNHQKQCFCRSFMLTMRAWMPSKVAFLPRNTPAEVEYRRMIGDQFEQIKKRDPVTFFEAVFESLEAEKRMIKQLDNTIWTRSRTRHRHL